MITEPEQAQLLAGLKPVQQQCLNTEWSHKIGENTDVLSTQSSSSSTLPPDADSQDEQGEQDGNSALKGMAGEAADGAGAASKTVDGAAVDRASDIAGSSGSSASASDVPAPFRERAAGMPFSGAAHWRGAAGLVSLVQVLADHRLIFSGGVVLLAWLAMMRRQGGILQFLSSVLRAVALYRETLQRLQCGPTGEDRRVH
jgi:hypothetical protein